MYPETPLRFAFGLLVRLPVIVALLLLSAVWFVAIAGIDLVYRPSEG